MGCFSGKACALQATSVPDAPGLAEYDVAAAWLAEFQVGGLYMIGDLVTVRAAENPESEILTEFKPGQRIQIGRLSSPPRCRAFVVLESPRNMDADRGWIQLVPAQQLRMSETLQRVLVAVPSPCASPIVQFSEQEPP